MKLYLTPVGDTGKPVGDTVVVGTHAQARQVIARFKTLGYKGVQQVRGDVICDFCSDPHVRWKFSITPGGEYTMRDVEGDRHIDYDGLWGACQECHDFIMKRDWIELGVRSGMALAAQLLFMPAEMIAMAVATAHAVFIQRWDGSDPERVISDDEFLAQANIEFQEGDN